MTKQAHWKKQVADREELAKKKGGGRNGEDWAKDWAANYAGDREAVDYKLAKMERKRKQEEDRAKDKEATTKMQVRLRKLR